MAIITNPAEVIKDIVTKELQPSVSFDNASYEDAVEDNTGLEMAFTIHEKQINSKKLIEAIASNAKIIPYIKNDELKFKGFNSAPQPELKSAEPPGDIELYIDSSDIISYKNSRTKPEQVYTEVNVNYHYDYALKDFTENYKDNSDFEDTATEYFSLDETTGLNKQGSSEPYSIANLGLNKEQPYTFDAHYIRELLPAEALQEFLLLWHCNQHNILKLKLPLKYIQLSIGDYVGFNELINGVKLFGEDYSISNFFNENYVYRNGQQILPAWMVTATNKTLTHINVDLIQMHNCSNQPMEAINTPPVVDSVGLELIHPETQNLVSGNNIVLMSGADEYFSLSLTASASDEGNDVLNYKFGYSSSIINGEFGGTPSSVGWLIGWDIIHDNWGGNGNYTTDLNTATLELGISGIEPPDDPNSGLWLITWLNNNSTLDGDYLQFPAGSFNVQAIEAEEDPALESNVVDFPSFRIYKNSIPPSLTVSYNEGWNLVGLPISMSDSSLQSVFPNSLDGTLYSFSDVYNPASSLDLGSGYWVNFDNAETVTFAGYPPESGYVVITVTEGWNLISPIGLNPIHIEDILNNHLLVLGSFFRFDETYSQAFTLEPGKGYWVRAIEDGEIAFNLG